MAKVPPYSVVCRRAPCRQEHVNLFMVAVSREARGRKDPLQDRDNELLRD